MENQERIRNFHYRDDQIRETDNFYIDEDFRMKLKYSEENYAPGIKAIFPIIKKFAVGRGLDIGGWNGGRNIYLKNVWIIDKGRISKDLGYFVKVETIHAERLDEEFSNSFNFIIHSHCLEHLLNPEKAVQECYRVLKPGGVLILYLLFPGHEYHDPAISPIKDKEHKWQPDPISIQRLLVLNGFDIFYLDWQMDEHQSFLTLGRKR